MWGKITAIHHNSITQRIRQESAFYEHKRDTKQHEGTIQRRAAAGCGGKT